MKFNFEELKLLSNQNSGKFSVQTEEEAFIFCQKLAKNHYENFPVGSILIPKKVRKHFYSIYSFARLGDDLGDENLHISIEDRIDILNQLGKNTSSLKSEQTNSPILKATLKSCEEFRIDKKLLTDLLKAFERDANFQPFNDFQDLEAYCRYSANPIGRILLALFNESSDENNQLSDNICTGLQLINFWQDISIDKTKKRVFIPVTNLTNNGLSINDYYKKENTSKFKIVIDSLIVLTEEKFKSGYPLLKKVKNKNLRLELGLIYFAGQKILSKIKTQSSDLCFSRPKLNKIDYISIVINALVKKK